MRNKMRIKLAVFLLSGSIGWVQAVTNEICEARARTIWGTQAHMFAAITHTIYGDQKNAQRELGIIQGLLKQANVGDTFTDMLKQVDDLKMRFSQAQSTANQALSTANTKITSLEKEITALKKQLAIEEGERKKLEVQMAEEKAKRETLERKVEHLAVGLRSSSPRGRK